MATALPELAPGLRRRAELSDRPVARSVCDGLADDWSAGCLDFVEAADRGCVGGPLGDLGVGLGLSEDLLDRVDEGIEAFLGARACAAWQLGFRGMRLTNRPNPYLTMVNFSRA
jgi:hypothetical protein